jgi:hypothetical protein
MAASADEAGLFKTVLEYAWIIVCALIGIVWKKHEKEMESLQAGIKKLDDEMTANTKFLDNRIDSVEHSSTPLKVFEKNREEMRTGQIQIFERLDKLGQSLARIEGKLDR